MFVQFADPGLDGVKAGFGGEFDLVEDGEILALDGGGVEAVAEGFGWFCGGGRRFKEGAVRRAAVVARSWRRVGWCMGGLWGGSVVG